MPSDSFEQMQQRLSDTMRAATQAREMMDEMQAMSAEPGEAIDLYLASQGAKAMYVRTLVDLVAQAGYTKLAHELNEVTEEQAEDESIDPIGDCIKKALRTISIMAYAHGHKDGRTLLMEEQLGDATGRS